MFVGIIFTYRNSTRDWTEIHEQTVQILIRLLLEEQSDWVCTVWYLWYWTSSFEACTDNKIRQKLNIRIVMVIVLRGPNIKGNYNIFSLLLLLSLLIEGGGVSMMPVP